MINNWNQLRCQAAISALQGLQEGSKITQLLEIDPKVLAKTAVMIGNALIEELQKDEAKREVEKYKDEFPNKHELLGYFIDSNELRLNPYLEKAINDEI